MKIYTKKGDKGTTSLLTGERVSKDDPRLEAGGTLDELIAWLGLIRDQAAEDGIDTPLWRIQKDLMTISSILMAGKKNPKLPRLSEEETPFLEKEIDRMNDILPPLKHFILPGGDPLASHCHIARTICRRAERQAVRLLKNDPSPDKLVQYLNRLSDYLFVLARYVTYKKDKNETYWLSDD